VWNNPVPKGTCKLDVVVRQCCQVLFHCLGEIARECLSKGEDSRGGGHSQGPTACTVGDIWLLLSQDNMIVHEFSCCMYGSITVWWWVWLLDVMSGLKVRPQRSLSSVGSAKGEMGYNSIYSCMIGRDSQYFNSLVCGVADQRVLQKTLVHPYRAGWAR